MVNLGREKIPLIFFNSTAPTAHDLAGAKKKAGGSVGAVSHLRHF